MATWLLKTEPSAYSFADLVRDKKAVWDGIRNPEARNNLRAAKKGDLVLVYHTGDERRVVGLGRITREAYPDPADADWLAVDIAPGRALAEPVTLGELKAEKKLADFALIRRSRLSVVPVTDAELGVILALGKTKL
ncbi:MAG: EVE domain-containing protein [Polyangiaceae bacterium]|nr:EVE domain-containing protein [Polyangiaceae bacterium]MCE7889567.1 EVE domain-containing protein [Sorangiineae bacterium PRO1]MCL4754513.1 EVE domain-containing protein [Myxococcales bacterium]